MKKLITYLGLFVTLVTVGWGQNTSGSISASDAGTCGTVNACVSEQLYSNTGTVAISVSGTFTATLQFEVSADYGATWVSAQGTAPSSTTATSTSAAGTWRFAVSGLTNFRVRGSAYTSGTAVVVVSGSFTAASLGGGGAAGGPFTLNGILFGNGTSTIQSTTAGGAGTLCLTEVNGGTPAFGACSGSAATAWSALTNPAANLALSMSTFTTTKTWGATTGAGTNLHVMTDTANNTGTGHIFVVNTASGSAAKPILFAAGGVANGVEMSTTGVLAKIGTGSVNADQVNGATVPTSAVVLGTNGSNQVVAATTTGSGTTVPLSTSPVLTTPRVTTINDANGNPFIASTATASAVDSVTVTNAATANPATVTISATGTDTNINLNLVSKGTGTVQCNGGSCGAGGSGTINAATQFSTPYYSAAGSATTLSGVANGLTGQVLTATNGAAPGYQSPSNPVGNGGAAVSLAAANYTIGCDSGTAIVDRGKWISVGTSGANSVILPDLAGSGCSGMYGGIENATSAAITLSRQTADTLTVYGGSGAAPLTALTTFSLCPGASASYSPDPTSTVYDIRISGPRFCGSSAMGTSAIASGACATAVTATATGLATTDVIIATPTADPTGVTGYAVSATGSLYIQAYPSANTVNFKVCNNTSGSLTPSPLTLNWRVL